MIKKGFRRFAVKHAMFVLALLPFCSMAQTIIADERDDSSLRRFELEPLTLVSTAKTKMNISFGAIGPSIYVRLSGSGVGTEIVNVNDKVIFRLDNNNTATGESNELQTYEVEGITSTYKHTYTISVSDIEKLSKNNIRSVRKYHAEEYDDINVPAQNARKVKNICAFLLEEYKKENRVGEDSVFIVQAKQEAAPGVKKEEPPAPLITRSPAFPGGENVWTSFLKRNLKAPEELKIEEKKIVQVQFRVSANGAVSEIQIVQSAGPAFDKEALRVLKRMPYWKPALDNGKPVDAVVRQDITFFREDATTGL
jgi:TonB family protein